MRRAARRIAIRTGIALLALAALLAAVNAEQADAGLSGERAQLLERIRRAPRQAEGFADLAIWLFRSGDLERAVSAASEAVRLEPGSAGDQRLLGYLHAAAGHVHKAESDFKRAAELDPNARTSLADLHLARAWAEYQEVLRSGRPNPALEERLRAVAAVAEVSPELKALMHSAVPPANPQPVEMAPPIYLGDGAAHVLVVEKRTQTLRLYGKRDGEVVLLQTYPCTTGQMPGVKERRGDLRTPDGVYVVTDLLPGSRLPDVYGTLALPLSYPNAWDRRLRRSGYGIWLHGSDRLGSPFTPRDTQGCVIVRNEDLLDLAHIIVPEVTPVLIAEDVPYLPIAVWKAAVKGILHDLPTPNLLAVAMAPDYTVLLHRDGSDVVRDFAEHGRSWKITTSERAPMMSSEEWQEKLASVAPPAATALLDVQVLDGDDAPRIVIETSGPAEARGFRPELGTHLYVDLPGVRAAPIPTIVRGSGSRVTQVRIAPSEFDPPSARLVIDLREPMDYQISNDGDRIVVSLLPEQSG